MPNRPRVLFVTYNFPPKLGGLEQVVWEVWGALRQRADVVTLAQHAPGEAPLEGVERAPRDGLARFFAFVLGRGWRQVRAQRFDVVVAGSALVAAPVLALARRGGARAVALTYGLDSLYPSLPYQALYRTTVPRFDRVIAISRATRDVARARGVPPERIEIVRPGCHGRRFAAPAETEALRRRFGLEGARVILSAGRLVRRKGVDRFVRECLPRILARVPEARLLLAGGNPEGALAHTEDQLERVEAAAREAGVASHVVVTGRLPEAEMVAAFQLADVFLLPVVPERGDMEGFGIVLLEAAAAGAPCVASDTGGIPDAVADGETGVLVPPLDHPAMAEAIIGFLADPARARAFGERGRQRVLREFLWEDVAPRWVEAILRPVEPEAAG